MSKQKFGASLSVKQCRNFGLDPMAVLQAAIKDLGLKRFRLMSYWDEIEKQQGSYDFSELDKQVAMIERANGEITMCLGVRQPRWPESHWPNWTKKMDIKDRNDALLSFITAVVTRYRNRSVIISWQLENEALLKDFGQDGDFDRGRLIREYKLVKKIGGLKPVIMTTSTSWGIPGRQPIPDIVGFSFYRVIYNNGYRTSIYKPWIFKLRARLIRKLHRRQSFIHELQAEPWGHKNIWEMTDHEQDRSMNLDLLKQNIQTAKATGLYPIDLWGLEWWFWRKSVIRKPDEWEMIKSLIQDA